MERRVRHGIAALLGLVMGCSSPGGQGTEGGTELAPSSPRDASGVAGAGNEPDPMAPQDDAVVAGSSEDMNDGASPADPAPPLEPEPIDACPDDPDKAGPGACGCGGQDNDSDQDGTADCDDACPEDGAKTAAGECGCGVSDEDADGDGTADCLGTDDDALCVLGGVDGACDCTGKVVHFVYFVEADASYSEDQRADIEAMAYAFQQYWYDQLGVTFYLNEPVVDVIMAEHDAGWYLSTPDGIHGDSRWYRLGNVKNEVYAELGIRDFDADHRVVNYPTSRHDGRVGGNFGGAWMDGDDLTCMAGEHGGVNFPYDEGGPAHCMGHVAHEFGHVLGLGHEGPNTDCMQFGFYNGTGGDGMCSFSDDNVAKILADPDNEDWFEALPGQRCQQP